MRTILRNRIVRQILVTSCTGLLGDGIFLLAVPLLAGQTGATPLWIGTIGAVHTMWWLFSVPLGTLVDHIGTGEILRKVRPLRIVAAIGIVVAVASHVQSLQFFLIVISAVWGFLEVLSDSAIATLPALLLPETIYDEAYSLLYSVQRVANLVLGPALAGFLFVLSSWAPFVGTIVFLIISLMAQLPLLRYAQVRSKREPNGSTETSYWTNLFGGWKHIVADRFLVAVIVTLVGIVIAEEVAATVVVPYARDGHMIADWESILAYLRSGAGLASIGIALFTSALARYFGRLRVMALAAAGGVVAPLLLAIQPNVSFIFAALLVSTAAEALWVPLAQAEIARRTPKELLVRTRGMMMFVTWGSLPIASLVGGVVATRLGVPVALFAAASLACITSLLGIWPLAIHPLPAIKREGKV